ncbi:hypothetical protein Q5752_000966 [Cryptotrichosporon argae]
MDKLDALLGPLNPSRQAASTAPSARRIVVFHAEGEKGSAVAREFIAVHAWRVRGLVRRHSEVSDVLCGIQVEVRTVDWDLPASFVGHVESADVVFLTSDVRAIHRALTLPEPDRTNTAREAAARQLAHACQACKRAGVDRVVVCAEAGEDVTAVERAASKWTVIRASAPFSAVLDWLRPAGSVGADSSPDRSGAVAPRSLADADASAHAHADASAPAESWVLNAPLPADTPIPGYAAELTGKYVLAAATAKGRYDCKEIEAVSQVLTPTELAGLFTSLSGKAVSAAPVLVKGGYRPDPKASKRVVSEQWDFTQWALQSAELKKLLGF